MLFFDTNCLAGISDEHFRFGEPWWDFWFPLQMIANGFSVGALENPLVTHRVHGVRWGRAYAEQFHHFCEITKTWKVDEEFSTLLKRIIREQRGSESSVAVSQFLRGLRLPREIKLLPTELGEVETFLRTAHQSFISAESASEHRRELNELKSSRSWRYTAFFRKS
jgi:hypothetical protein